MATSPSESEQRKRSTTIIRKKRHSRPMLTETVVLAADRGRAAGRIILRESGIFSRERGSYQFVPPPTPMMESGVHWVPMFPVTS